MELAMDIIPNQAMNALRGLGLNVASGWSIRAQANRTTLLLIWETNVIRNRPRNRRGGKHVQRQREQSFMQTQPTSSPSARIHQENKLQQSTEPLSKTTSVIGGEELQGPRPMVMTAHVRTDHVPGKITISPPPQQQQPSPTSEMHASIVAHTPKPKTTPPKRPTTSTEVQTDITTMTIRKYQQQYDDEAAATQQQQQTSVEKDLDVSSSSEGEEAEEDLHDENIEEEQEATEDIEGEDV